MAAEDERRTRYDEARRNFDDLSVEERTRLLVEGTALTLAEGLLQAGEALADGLEDVIRQARQRSSRRAERHGPGAAEPETAQRRAPRSGSPDTDPDT